MSYYKTIIKTGYDSILDGDFKYECKFAFFPKIYNENSEPCMSNNGPYKQFNNKVEIPPEGGILSVGIDYVKVSHSKFKDEDVLLGIYTLTGDNISDIYELRNGISKHTCILTPNTDISINTMEQDINKLETDSVTEMLDKLSLKPLSLKEVKNKVETVEEETESVNINNLFQLIFVIYIKKEAYDAYINHNNLESASRKIRSIYNFTKKEIINNCPENTGQLLPSFIKKANMSNTDTILSAQALVNTAENEMFSLYTMI
jgi:hypothetical protein